MLRLDACLLGRWSHRDFLRGRTKLGGSIHTRHTHGCRGRYKRLSSIYGLRDGRRHAWNHLHGGLGVKLGGGLFGLRIPRQHALSTLSKEEYDIILHGHPNITNPYRLFMNKHPNLESVMRNARLHVDLVLLMPRVPRTIPRTGLLPCSWEDLVLHVSKALQEEATALLQNCVTIYFATMFASSMCLSFSEGELRSAASALFEDHMRGAKLNFSTETTSSQRNGKGKCHKFFGTHLLNRVGLQSFSAATQQESLSSSCALPQVASPTVAAAAAGAVGRCTTSTNYPERVCLLESYCNTKTSDPLTGSAAMPSDSVDVSHVVQHGVQELLVDLRHNNPGALSICLRLDGISNNGPPSLGDEEESNRKNKRKLLRVDLDPDEVGVWKRPAASVDALMRWQYLNWDPRGHCADVLAHDRRKQPVCIFVDASRMRHGGKSSAPEEADRQKHPTLRSLLSARFAERLAEMDYQRVNNSSLPGTLADLRRWTVDHQWRTAQMQCRAVRQES
uniref:Uncharacterized protein TCIL3000_6_1970 n=1 Tax=Trypanosoma congolense (strain IL3000) TaxID=1068625 RepID=G0UNK2_TRYCI|nr:unnamed protein product [Trypanosoma congolense IL3000]